MKNIYLLRFTGVLAGFLALALVDASRAALILRLDDGVNPVVTLTDGGPGDASATAGVVTFNDSLGLWAVNVTTGLGDPVLGLPNFPRIDLNSVNVSTAGSGTLDIYLTQTNNTSIFNPLGFIFDIGGTTDGTVTAAAFFDASNTAFGMATPIANLGALGSGAFSASGTGSNLSAQGPFSITIKTSIAHARAGATSFNADLNSVPEPGTIGLMGAALLALGFIRRKRAA